MTNRRVDTLLRYLINQDDYVPVKTIALFLNVSTKTVYRDLELVKSIDGIDIEIKRGTGVKINLLDGAFLENYEKSVELGESNSQRRKEIIIKLLKQSDERTSVQKLSEEYYVSQTSILNDLKYIKSWLNSFNISLESDYDGTSIVGSEKDIRNAYNSALMPLTHDFTYVLSPSESRIEDSTLNILSKEFGYDNVDYVELLVGNLEESLGFEIVDPYYINLITHILILVQRLRTGNVVYNVSLNTTDIRAHYLTAATRITDQLSEYFEISIPEEETLYIYQHIDSIGGNISTHDRNEQFKKYESRVSDYLVSFCDSLITETYRELSISPSKDEQLRGFLLVHLHAVVNRMKYGIKIRCPLRKVIFEEYSSVFKAVKVGSEKSMIKYYPDFSLSDDECCYIALYFQSQIEKDKSKKYRVLVVCSSGVGTSQMVVSRLKGKLDNLEIVDHIAASYLNNDYISSKNIDFIISTVNIDKKSIEVPIILISVLVSQMDVDSINEQIRLL